MAFFISQMLMAISTAIILVAFQAQQERLFRWGFIVAGALAGVHFLLLGAYTAACVALLNTARWAVSLFSKRWYWFFVYAMLATGILYVTYDSWVSFVSFVAGIIATIAVFQKSQLRARAILMGVDVLWIINNVLVMTPVGVVAHVLFLGSNVVGYRALQQKPQE